MSLLRKETLHWHGEERGAFFTRKFTSADTLVKEVIAWILTVHSFPTFTYCPCAYLKRGSNLHWALQQPRRLGEGLILMICMNN
jgi:hypothetical protein